MSTIKEVITAYRKLSLTDRLVFFSTLTDQLAELSEEAQEFVLETRYNDGIRCPFCRAAHIVKNGRRRDGTQRYLCRECRKSFLSTTDSVISGTRKRLTVWKKYFHCMAEKKTLRESAAVCSISMGTAFLWRHKILDALQRMDRSVVIGGTVEVDETYTAVSYKGNHSKSRNFHGVSTKYLGHYLLWHDRMFCSAIHGTEAERVLFTAVLAETYRVRCREISRRPAVPFGNNHEKEAAA